MYSGNELHPPATLPNNTGAKAPLSKWFPASEVRFSSELPYLYNMFGFQYLLKFLSTYLSHTLAIVQLYTWRVWWTHHCFWDRYSYMRSLKRMPWNCKYHSGSYLYTQHSTDACIESFGSQYNFTRSPTCVLTKFMAMVQSCERRINIVANHSLECPQRQSKFSTFKCRYNAVQYYKLFHTALHWLKHILNQCQITNHTPYFTLKASYGLHFLRIRMKIERVKTAVHGIEKQTHLNIVSSYWHGNNNGDKEKLWQKKIVKRNTMRLANFYHLFSYGVIHYFVPIICNPFRWFLSVCFSVLSVIPKGYPMDHGNYAITIKPKLPSLVQV